MKENFKKIILNYLKSADKVVVAVSRGVDSVVLLDLLSKVTKNMTIAHVNHGLRKESDKEEAFVRELAAKYNLSIYVSRLKLTKKTEEEARKKRYQFLRRVREKTGSRYIVTAHHLNDQAETILLNLVRGTGPLKVWGMQEAGGDILRPLLNFSKEEILSYAKSKKLKYVTDPSNKDVSFSRNRLRHKVIPELEKINPRFLEAIKTEVVLGRELNDFVFESMLSAEKKVCAKDGLSVTKLKNYPLFIQKEIIRRAIWEMLGREEGVYSRYVNEVLKIMEGAGRKKSEISGFTIVRECDKITFGFKEKMGRKRARLLPGKETLFNGFKLSLSEGKGKPHKNNVLLSPKFAYNLSIRTWRAGDRIKTASGTKKVQDIFTDAKIPAEKRKMWPLVTKGREILWVAGLAANSDVIVREDEKALIVEVVYER